MSRAHEAAREHARQAAADVGATKGSIAAELIDLHGTPRATAYRIAGEALASAGVPTASDTVERNADGLLLLPAEAERQYIDALERQDHKLALRWFETLVRLSQAQTAAAA
jgi:hypothetical protein